MGGRLSPDELTGFTTTLEAGGAQGPVLLDSLRQSMYHRAFLNAYRPSRVVPVGSFAQGVPDLDRRLDLQTAKALDEQGGRPVELWKALFPRAEQVVVSPTQPRPLFLQASCLAASLHAPLFVVDGKPNESSELREWLEHWNTSEVLAVGEARLLCRGLTQVHVSTLKNEAAVAEAYLRQLARQGPIHTLVVANPFDMSQCKGTMSALAPWVALRHHAALLFTDLDGKNVEEVVRGVVPDRRLRSADTVILVASLDAIPTKRRPNPIPGDRDQEIEMEPLTPNGNEPFSFSVGRLFHDDPSVVLLQLARQQLLAEAGGPRRALVASNPGGSLPLLETFSRSTAKELGNAGYETKTLFNHDVTRDELRRLMPNFDIVLWEGHHNTLIKDWEMPDWDEPMAPSLVFLQSCLALMESKAQPLMQRGAVAVIGTSTRTYSASGGAMSLAFFDALLYEDQTLGGSLRQAKNFLLAYSLLKEKRLGEEAKRTGANQRATWAFTLWGDPTLRLPKPTRKESSLEQVRHEVHGNTITLRLPPDSYRKTVTAKYQVELTPNARLAGLVKKEKGDDGQPLIPLVFAEIPLPRAPSDLTPRLHSKLPSTSYVFCWDARRRCGYLLVEPRTIEEQELRFSVDWE